MPRPGRIHPLDVAGVVLLCLVAILAGIWAILLSPLHIGTAIVPVTVLVAIVANIALPTLARRLIDSTVAAALPYLAWLATVIVLGLLPRPSGDVLLPGGGIQQVVSLGMLLAGVLAGAVTLGVAGPRRR